MDLSLINKLIETYNGNYSLLYGIIKDRVPNYPEYELPFPYEFICFEDVYYHIAKHMLENNIPVKTVVDIGCQLGFQSEIFIGKFNYIGIDNYKPTEFFNNGNENVSYLVETFPQISVDLSDKCVISSMSIGYFHVEGYTNKDMAKKLSEAKYLYLVSTPEIRTLVEKYFAKKEKLEVREKDTVIWYFSK